MIKHLQAFIGAGTNPHRNLAIEEYLTDTVPEDTLIVYLWQNKHTVVIGRNQNAWAECRTAELERDGGTLARRLSGGGAVYHDMGNLNFTFSLRTEDYDLRRQQSVIVEACRMLGIPAEISGRNDILTNGCKFSGNSFYSHNGCSFHNGTLLLSVDMANLGKYLTPSKVKLESKGVASVRSRVINLTELVPTLTVAQMEKIEGAQLVLESGLGLEDFMEGALSGKTRIDIASGLPTLTGDEGVDPHWWLDPTRFQQAAATAARELGAQYPEFSDRITENLAAFDEKLSDLQAYGDEALANLSCRELVTFHDGFSYFADSFGLTIAAAMEVESGSEPSAKELEAIIAIVEENQIPAVFYETNGEAASAEVVANETGCSVWTLDMAISSGDYFAAMRENIDIVKEALG